MESRFQRGEGRRHGYTLVELMVVIVIIGIIVTLLAPNLSGVGRRSVMNSTAQEVAARVRAARDLAISSGRCVAVWQAHNGTNDDPKRLMVGQWPGNVFDCEGATTRIFTWNGCSGGCSTTSNPYKVVDTGALNASGSTVPVVLTRVRELEMFLPTDRTIVFDTWPTTPDDMIVWRPTGWLRGAMYGTATSWSLTPTVVKLKDPAIKAGTQSATIVIEPHGHVCVNPGGSTC